VRSGALARGVLLVAQATLAIAVATVRARTFNMAFICITSLSPVLCNARTAHNRA